MAKTARKPANKKIRIDEDVDAELERSRMWEGEPVNLILRRRLGLDERREAQGRRPESRAS